MARIKHYEVIGENYEVRIWRNPGEQVTVKLIFRVIEPIYLEKSGDFLWLASYRQVRNEIDEYGYLIEPSEEKP